MLSVELLRLHHLKDDYLKLPFHCRNKGKRFALTSQHNEKIALNCVYKLG